MGREDAENILLDAGGKTDGDFPLLEAAIACAVHEDPSRDPKVAYDLGAASVDRLAQRLKQESAEEAIAETMAGDLRLAGDLFTLEDPDNADIIAVSERRKGLAVALGVFYLHAGRHCGLTVQGVDFPGHFLLRIETEEGPLALDPFSEGRVVLPSELTRRALHAGLTPNVADRLDRLMAPVSDRAVLIRLQNTIFARAQQMRDFARAERAAIRRALLDPADHRPWLDVAAAREGQGALAGSLEALARATELDGGAALAARAQRERVRLQLELMTQAYDLDHAPIVLVQQRGKIALAMLGCLGFVALGVWLPVAAPGNTKAMLASVLAILFFGGLAVRGAASLAKPSIVTLASDGLGLETAFGARHVSWSDLEDISLVRIRRTQVVALKARTASGLSSGLYRALGLPGNSGLPGGLPIDQQDLYALLTRAKARWS